jgi:hypothetical protein
VVRICNCMANVRVNESLGGRSGASVITMERSLDQRDVVRAALRIMQAGKMYGGVTI